MAEIYSSSLAASHSTLSQEDYEHIQSVLSDLGLADGSPAPATAHGSEAAAPPPATPDIADGGGAHPASSFAGADDGGAFHISGLGDDMLAGGDAGHGAPVAADAPPDAVSDAGAAPVHADTAPAQPPAAHDTLAGGNGMDTLWGSDASATHATTPDAAATDAHAAASAFGGADTTSAFAVDTLDAAHAAALPAAGDPAIVHAGADTLHAYGSHDTLDGSASTHATSGDVTGAHSTIIGGAGNDTLAQHDASGGADHQAQSETVDGAHSDWGAGYATLAGGAGGDDASNWTGTQSVAGGDGSDIYAMSHHGAGFDTADAGGAGTDGAGWHDAANSHFADPATTIVTFGDGYGAHPTGYENIHFHDTVYNI